MARAVWNGQVVAEAPDHEIQMVEGNAYFPPTSLKREFFSESSRTTTCPWKGKASYYNLVVDGQTNEGAAWSYRAPSRAASQIRDHVAFWRGVKVER